MILEKTRLTKDLAFGDVPGEVFDEDDDQNDSKMFEFTIELSEKIEIQILSISIRAKRHFHKTKRHQLAWYGRRLGCTQILYKYHPNIDQISPKYHRKSPKYQPNIA